MIDSPSLDADRSSRSRLLNPTNDLVFKLLLTGPKSHEVLRYVLEAVLKPPVPIRAFTVANPAILPHDIDEKQIFFDVRVVLVDGSEIIVEMQCLPTFGFRDRLVYYAARGLVGQLERGGKYHELEPSIVIAFLGYREFDDALFHKRFHLVEQETLIPFSPVLQIHTVELGKLAPLDTDPAARHDPLVVFARFLTAHSDHELAEIAEESPAMKQAVDILENLSKDADVRRQAADREARLQLDAMYQAGALREAREEGRQEGREEGREEGRTGTLLRQLERKFGPIDAGTRDRIRAASPDELDLYLDRILFVETLAAVFAPAR